MFLCKILTLFKGSKRVKKRSKVGSIFRVDLLTRPDPCWSTFANPSSYAIFKVGHTCKKMSLLAFLSGADFKYKTKTQCSLLTITNILPANPDTQHFLLIHIFFLRNVKIIYMKYGLNLYGISQKF